MTNFISRIWRHLKHRPSRVVACSDCFNDEGLRLDAEYGGSTHKARCPRCGLTSGRKLSRDQLGILAHRFFVWGSMSRFDYGAAPLIQFNDRQVTSIEPSTWLRSDINIIEDALGVGFFHYGPRFWMFGETEPLEALRDQDTRAQAAARIVKEYPTLLIDERSTFYRMRKNPLCPADPSEYDSPPAEHAGVGRLDAPDSPVMYASPDLELCAHECRIATEDELYVATIRPLSQLRLLDLSVPLEEENVTEFESLDLAVIMVFLAGSHSYEISRAIAFAARSSGYDGISYPSYFSLLRTGAMPFETAYGISYRRFPQLREYEQSKIVRNLAIFGRPISEGRALVRCINRLVVNGVKYSFHFGPVEY